MNVDPAKGRASDEPGCHPSPFARPRAEGIALFRCMLERAEARRGETQRSRTSTPLQPRGGHRAERHFRGLPSTGDPRPRARSFERVAGCPASRSSDRSVDDDVYD